MNDKVYSQLMGIVTRVQNYPGLTGLEQIKAKVDRICQENNSPCPKSIELFLNAYTFDRHDKLTSAIASYNLCLSSLTDIELPLRVYINALLASIHIEAENYTTAYVLYKEVLENIQLLDDNIRSLIYCNISDMYLCLDQYEQAIEYAKQGVTAAKNSNNVPNKTISLLNIGYAYGHLSQFKKAISIIHRAKNIAKKNNSSRIVALSYGYLAQVLAKQPNTPQELVIDYFKKAEVLYSGVHDKHNQLENSLFFAQYLDGINHNDDALLLCKKIEKELQTTNNYGFYRIYANVQANLIEKQQQWPQLIAHQKQHIQKAEKTLDILKQQQNKALIKNVDVIEDNQQQQVLSNMQEHMGAITEIGQYIATAPDLTASLPGILTKINTILPTFEFGIALYDKETHDLDYRYFVDINGLVSPLIINCQQDKTVGTYVIKHRATVHLNTVTDDALAPFVDNVQRKQNDMVIRKNSPATYSIIMAPIILKDDVLGLLSVQHNAANQYHEHHRHLVEHLASFIAVSLENQKQRQRLEDANKTLEQLSKTEPLTGLYNRYQLDKITPKLIEQALSEHIHIAVLMLDLDDYKAYNDTFGHIAGDDVLKVISQLMKKAFNDSNDYLFRYGGDEFLIISFDQTSNAIEAKIHCLRDSLYQANLPNPKSRYSDRLSVSIGGINTQLNQSSSVESFSQLCHIADKQLYKVKDAGRNDYLLI